MATIAENLQAIQDIKQDIKTAIENKGVDMSNTPFSDYSTKIDEITSGTAPVKINVKEYGIKFGNSTFTEIPVVFDFSNVTDMSNMFYYCQKLTTIPQFDTSKATNMGYMFQDCTNLQSIPLLDCSKVKYMSNMFGSSDNTTLTEIGGFKNLQISITSKFLDKAPNLTTESLMNVINNVYDLTANGLSGQSLKFGSTNLNKLTAEQVAIATAKGWTLTA